MSSTNKWKISTYFLKVKTKTTNITWRTVIPPKYQHWEQRFNIHHPWSHAKGCDCLHPMNHATRHTVMHTTHTMCCTTLSQTQVVGIIYTATNINLLKPHGYFMCHPVSHSKILHGSHIAFMCHVWISEQTATFALHNFSKTDFV